MPRITTYQWTRSRFEIEIAGDRCSSEEFGQEHAHLLVVRAQGAVAGDTQRYGYWTLRLKKAIANKHRCPILCPKAVICKVIYGHNGNSSHIFLKYRGGASPMVVVQIEKPGNMALANWFCELRSWLDQNYCHPMLFNQSERVTGKMIFDITFSDESQARVFILHLQRYAPQIRRTPRI
jgi:hypothetical protein